MLDSFQQEDTSYQSRPTFVWWKIFHGTKVLSWDERKIFRLMKDEYSEEKLGWFWVGTNVCHITNAKLNFLILILSYHKMTMTLLTLVKWIHTLQNRIYSMWWKIMSHLKQIYRPQLMTLPISFISHINNLVQVQQRNRKSFGPSLRISMTEIFFLLTFD